MDNKIRKEDEELLKEYQSQIAQDDRHEYTVYGVDTHSDHSDCCC